MVHRQRWLIGTLVAVALVVALTLSTPGGQESVAAPGQTPIYVDADASSGNNDGSSWEDAFTTLQPALDAASSGHEIWVAAGTYKPTWESSPGDPRSATFQLKNGVALYGGFDPPLDDEWEERDWKANPTILSGDLNGDDEEGFVNNDENSYHVFYHPAGTNLDGTSLLDGFTISGGNANGGVLPHGDGGGMYNDGCSPALTDVFFGGNRTVGHGGGMYNLNGSSPTLTNCQFASNIADSDGSGSGDGGGMSNEVDSSPVLSGTQFFTNVAYNGGGMHNGNGSNPKLTDVTFSGNAATADGGGMHNYPSTSPALTNVTFSGNTATVDGGGMSNGDSSPTLTNVTFSGNTATDNGGGIYNWRSVPTLTNCILWGDTAGGLPEEIYNSDAGSTPVVTYSDIQGDTLYPGTGNINADPLFIDAAGGDLRLQLTSPAIDAGDKGAPGLAGVTTDLAGHPRFADVVSVIDTGNGEPPIVDMGAQEAPPEVIYVDQDANGANDGASWADAFTDLQDALSWAMEGVEIWVAAGIYTPTSGSDRAASFQLAKGVAVYGGFAGTEASRDARDWILHETILSGDLAGDDEDDFANNDENSYHVVYSTGVTETAVLDGFTITGGNANGNFPHDRGGGLLNEDSSPTLSNCSFAANSASYGGGMMNAASSPTLTDVTFSGNSADGSGGGMYNSYSSPIVTNCTFSGNSATNDGGGMFNGWSAKPYLTNCIFWGNSGGGMGGIEHAAPVLTNCILWNNSPYQIGGVAEVTYSDIQGGRSGMGNIDADPLFVDPASGDFHLWHGSPCIDAGDNDAPDLPEYDFEGDDRILDGDADGEPRVDMGVDEVVYEAPPPVIFVDADAGATPARDGTSWADALTDLQYALAWAEEGVEIWVAAGTYTPTAEHGGTGDRYRSFQMANGVAVYGGFDPSAGATVWEDRDWTVHETILSGDLDGDDGNDFANNGENSYHVFYHPSGTALDSSAILDGFTVTGGNANGSNPHDRGGGMYNLDSSPALSNCTFSGNSADSEGGGMCNDWSSPTLINCTFAGNSAGSKGGGMYNFDQSIPTLTNCTFADNSASFGGGMYNVDAWPALTNCILWGDAGDEIGGASATVTYSDIQGGYGGEGNIDADPLFVDPASGDFHLGPGSPCIDTGTNDAPYLPDYDFEGDDRILDGDGDGTATVDMGVDEAAVRVYLPLVVRGY